MPTNFTTSDAAGACYRRAMGRTSSRWINRITPLFDLVIATQDC